MANKDGGGGDARFDTETNSALRKEKACSTWDRHFSFDERGREQKPRHGHFTLIVDSSDVDSAVEAFTSLIRKMKTKNGSFGSVAQIYIEDIFEVEKVPQRPVMLRFQSSEGPFPESANRSLPLGDDTGINAFGWAPDIRKIRAANKDDTVEMEPFLVFD